MGKIIQFTERTESYLYNLWRTPAQARMHPGMRTHTHTQACWHTLHNKKKLNGKNNKKTLNTGDPPFRNKTNTHTQKKDTDQPRKHPKPLLPPPASPWSAPAAVAGNAGRSSSWPACASSWSCGRCRCRWWGSWWTWWAAPTPAVPPGPRCPPSRPPRPWSRSGYGPSLGRCEDLGAEILHTVLSPMITHHDYSYPWSVTHDHTPWAHGHPQSHTISSPPWPCSPPWSRSYPQSPPPPPPPSAWSPTTTHHDQSPTTTHHDHPWSHTMSHDQSPAITHTWVQSPTITHHDQSPTITHHDQSPTITHTMSAVTHNHTPWSVTITHHDHTVTTMSTLSSMITHPEHSHPQSHTISAHHPQSHIISAWSPTIIKWPAVHHWTSEMPRGPDTTVSTAHRQKTLLKLMGVPGQIQHKTPLIFIKMLQMWNSTKKNLSQKIRKLSITHVVNKRLVAKSFRHIFF